MRNRILWGTALVIFVVMNLLIARKEWQRPAEARPPQSGGSRARS